MTKGYENIKNMIFLGFNCLLPICPLIRGGISTEVVGKMVADIYKNCANPQKLLVTFGLEHKIDLKSYGGFGFKILDKIYTSVKDEEARSDLFRDNALRLFSWWAPKPAPKTYGNIKVCSICGTETEDASKWFSKDGLFFATPACFKKYLSSKRS